MGSNSSVSQRRRGATDPRQNGIVRGTGHQRGRPLRGLRRLAALPRWPARAAM